MPDKPVFEQKRLQILVFFNSLEFSFCLQNEKNTVSRTCPEKVREITQFFSCTFPSLHLFTRHIASLQFCSLNRHFFLFKPFRLQSKQTQPDNNLGI